MIGTESLRGFFFLTCYVIHWNFEEGVRPAITDHDLLERLRNVSEVGLGIHRNLYCSLQRILVTLTGIVQFSKLLH